VSGAIPNDTGIQICVVSHDFNVTAMLVLLCHLNRCDWHFERFKWHVWL